MNPRRGEIYLVNLEPTSGSEMKKTRPALIVSIDGINQAASVVIVCPITDAKDKFSPVHIPVDAGAGGLAKKSVVHCGQVRAVDKLRLMKKLGELDDATMESVAQGLRLALGV